MGFEVHQQWGPAKPGGVKIHWLTEGPTQCAHHQFQQQNSFVVDPQQNEIVPAGDNGEGAANHNAIQSRPMSLCLRERGYITEQLLVMQKE
jgi:hypothetical protein